MPSFNMQCPVEQVSASVCFSIVLPPWSKRMQAFAFLLYCHLGASECKCLLFYCTATLEQASASICFSIALPPWSKRVQVSFTQLNCHKVSIESKYLPTSFTATSHIASS